MKLEDLEKLSITNQVRDFYDQHPYPPPVSGLDEYRQIWQDEGRRRADFHLFWPAKPYREKLQILVAGCGTSQAARYAVRYPSAQIFGVDISTTSIQETEKLKRQYELNNLELVQLPIEQVEELDQDFDLIICTGVLHHLSDPQVGLHALSQVLKPEGALHLMVYATYGRTGIYMLQEYARIAGVGDAKQEINDFAHTLMSLPRSHPLAPLLAESPDFRTRAGLADALLNPQDSAYTVPEFLDFISSTGLRFRRWLRQAPYLPQCGKFAETPHFPRLDQLPQQDQFAAMELLRGTMLRHSAIIHHQTDFTDEFLIPTNHPQWQFMIPLRSPGSIIVQDNLPAGADAVIINQQHTFPDLVLPVDKSQLQIFETIDGLSTMGEIISSLSYAGNNLRIKSSMRIFFQQLWNYDHVVFDTSGITK